VKKKEEDGEDAGAAAVDPRRLNLERA